MEETINISDIDNFRFSNEYATVFSACDVSLYNTVYHYTSPLGLLGILETKGKAKLWFTQYDCLNDMSEGKDISEFTTGYCDYLVKDNQISDEFSKIIKMLQPQQRGLFTYKGKPVKLEHRGVVDDWTELRGFPYQAFICCFSKQADSLAMWNYYSKGRHYEGYNLGVLPNRLKSSGGFEEGYLLEIKRVIYDNKEKIELLNRIIFPLFEIYQKSNDDEKIKVIECIQFFFNEYQFYFKKDCFAHENEIRAVLKIPTERQNDGKQFPIHYRSSNGYIIPYVEYLCNDNVIQSVGVAPLLKSDIAVRNIEQFLKANGYCQHTKIPVKASEVPIRF